MPGEPNCNSRQAQQDLHDHQKTRSTNARRQPADRHNLARSPGRPLEEGPQRVSIANRHVGADAANNDRTGANRHRSRVTELAPEQRQASKRDFFELFAKAPRLLRSLGHSFIRRRPFHLGRPLSKQRRLVSANPLGLLVTMAFGQLRGIARAQQRPAAAANLNFTSVNTVVFPMEIQQGNDSKVIRQMKS
jgi:hypothetical protein